MRGRVSLAYLSFVCASQGEPRIKNKRMQRRKGRGRRGTMKCRGAQSVRRE